MVEVALMARPVAGVRKQTIILTLPGSPKGAKENLEAVLKLLPHACIQAAGAESRQLHVGGVKKLEQDAGVSSSDPPKGTESLIRFTLLLQFGFDNIRYCRCKWSPSSPSWAWPWPWPWTRWSKSTHRPRGAAAV